MRLQFKIVLIFLSLAFSALGQDSIAEQEEKVPQELIYDIDSSRTPLLLDKDALEGYKNDEAYHYKDLEEQRNWWTDFTNWLSRLWQNIIDWIFGDYEPGGFVSLIIQVLPYILVASVVIFLIWMFYKINPGARMMKNTEDPKLFFTEEEELIKTADLKSLITKALEDGNYRLAVRYYYLLILKSLTQKELIAYEFDKTNSDYFSEIKSPLINSDFKKVTHLYDYIWYGNFEVSPESYGKAQHSFSQLENLINKPS
ncbi:MAG: hypothetical protein ACJA1Z_001025 [Patiriisocius sp.]